jgi:hypothetical protein
MVQMQTLINQKTIEVTGAKKTMVAILVTLIFRKKQELKFSKKK